MPSIRNYFAQMEKLQSSIDLGHRLEMVGEFNTPEQRYPFYKIIVGKGNSKRVLISAGIHGDEPAGVETIINFFCNKLYQSYDWEITLLPCLNPYGYEYDTRLNYHNQDLNRLFKKPSPPHDIQMIQSIFENRYDLSIELHEDVDSSGYYLFQSAHNDSHRQVGRKIIAKLGSVLPINEANDIEGMPAVQGVIDRLARDDSMTWWPMALYSASKETSLCFTLETPTTFPMQVRVQAHLTAIDCALREFIICG